MAKKRDNAPIRHQTKRKLTSNQEEWEHQAKNLKRRIRDLAGLGAVVDFVVGERPKRVTKEAIEKLKNIGRKQLEKLAYKVDEWGELVKWEAPERGKAKERREEVKEQKRQEKERQKAQEPDYGYDEDEYAEDSEAVQIAQVEIDNLRDYIADLGDAEVADRLENILDNMIAQFGMVSVADAIGNKFESITEYAMLAAKYKGTSKGNGFVNQVAQLLAGDRVLSFGELAAIERANDFNDDFSRPR